MQLTSSKDFKKIPFKLGELVTLLDNDKTSKLGYGIVMGYSYNHIGVLIVKVLWNKKISLNPRWMFPDTLRIAVK